MNLIKDAALAYTADMYVFPAAAEAMTQEALTAATTAEQGFETITQKASSDAFFLTEVKKLVAYPVSFASGKRLFP